MKNRILIEKALIFSGALILSLVLLSFVVAFVESQDEALCDQVIEVNSLPFYDSFCVEEPFQSYENSSSFLHPDSGCWSCMLSPQTYRFEVVAPSHLEMTLSSELYSSLTNNQTSVYYAIFNACPYEGGTVLSYPVNGNNSQGQCWEEFGEGQGLEVVASCFNEGCCSWSGAPFCYVDGISGYGGNVFNEDETNTGTPPWSFPASSYWMDFYLQPGEYWIFVFAPGCNLSTSYGCIEVEFDGASFLQVQFPLDSLESVEVPLSNSQEIIYEGGHLKKVSEGIYIDFLGRIVKINNDDTK